MSTVSRPRVFLDIDIAGKSQGRLVFELFVDKTPLTCENFRQLCTGEHEGLSYEGSSFHRVIEDFMIQGGDIASGDGTGIVSIYGNAFNDENLEWRQLDASNLLCSANRGKDTNGSQFFITLAASPHLNGRHTIFGRLVSGEDVLQAITHVAVDDDDKPTTPVTISRCGELERRNKRPPTTTTAATVPHDRGRARDGQAGHVPSKLDVPVSRTTSRKRRASDNVIDEGLRGRPRKRSKPRADESAVEEDSPNDDSPVKIHKRGRSPSPGPALSTDGEHSYERRRRPSLPNQYRDKRGYDRRDDNRMQRYDNRRDGTSSYHHRTNRDEHREYDAREQRRPRGHQPHSRNDNAAYGHWTGSTREQDVASVDGVKFKGRGTMKYREPGRL